MNYTVFLLILLKIKTIYFLNEWKWKEHRTANFRGTSYNFSK